MVSTHQDPLAPPPPEKPPPNDPPLYPPPIDELLVKIEYNKYPTRAKTAPQSSHAQPLEPCRTSDTTVKMNNPMAPATRA